MSTSPASPNGRKETNGKPGRPTEAKTADQSAAGLVEQAEGVRSSLREALANVGDLITSFKQHHKRTKTVRAALASLRQLEKVGA